MPIAVSQRYYYQITVVEHSGTVHTGVRDLISSDIEHAYTLFFNEAQKAYGGKMEDFECVQLSVQSRLVKGHLKEVKTKKRSTEPPEIKTRHASPPIGRGGKGPGKYRDDKAPREKPFREKD
jgi:hypothetical protein